MHSINEAKKVTWDTYMEYTFGVNKKERKFTIVYHTKLQNVTLFLQEVIFLIQKNVMESLMVY